MTDGAQLEEENDEKQFVCGMCGQGFNKASHYNNHLKQYHPDVAKS